MIYLIVAILFGSLFAILFKLFAKHGVDALQAIIFNYITAIAIGPLTNIIRGEVAFSALSAVPLLPAILTGLFMVGGFIAMSNATKSHGVAIATIATRVSFIIPTICAYLFLGEKGLEPTTSLMVIISLFMIFFTNRRGLTLNKWYNPLLVFLCYGAANFLLKYCQAQLDTNSELLALTTITFTSALIIAIIFLRLQKGNLANFKWKNLLAGVILGVTNIGCTFFLLKALTLFSTALLYPIYNISIVVTGIIAGRLIFKERLTTLQYIGIAIAITAIIIAL
ncbi:MAG: EamA family transporter [Marinifilaceae bacterium]|nr:EamA family transporter [Marinifilaceae bacterium]